MALKRYVPFLPDWPAPGSVDDLLPRFAGSAGPVTGIAGDAPMADCPAVAGRISIDRYPFRTARDVVAAQNQAAAGRSLGLIG